MRNKLQTINIYTRVDKKKINSSRKEYVIGTCFFDQWKTFSKNHQPMRAWLWLVYKFTENYCHLRPFYEFIQTPKRDSSSLEKIGILTCHTKLKCTTCHIKLIYFLWPKLLGSLLLAKYFISVAATLVYFFIVEIFRMSDKMDWEHYMHLIWLSWE